MDLGREATEYGGVVPDLDGEAEDRPTVGGGGRRTAGRANDEDGAAAEEGRRSLDAEEEGCHRLEAEEEGRPQDAEVERAAARGFSSRTRRRSGMRRPDPRGGEGSPRGNWVGRVSRPRVACFQTMGEFGPW